MKKERKMPGLMNNTEKKNDRQGIGKDIGGTGRKGE